MGWHSQTFPSAQIIHRLFTTAFSNAIISGQFSKRKPGNLSNEYLLLHLLLIITPMVWWYISILTSNESHLYMEMRPTIISSGLTRDLWIS